MGTVIFKTNFKEKVMRTIFLISIMAALSLQSCNKKTSTAVTSASKETPQKKDKPATLDELKGGKIQAKQLPEDKLNDLKKSNPENKKPAEENYKSYYDSGYQKHNAGDFQGAISDFSKCIALNSQFSDAYAFRALSKFKSGDKTGACADWKTASQMGQSGASQMMQKYCQ